MRIVTREAFLTLPAGTVFASWDDGRFGELSIKTACLPNDWIAQPLVDAISARDPDHRDELMAAAMRGEDVPVDYDCAARDGMFDDEQWYAVWSRNDVAQLGACLKMALLMQSLETKG